MRIQTILRGLCSVVVSSGLGCTAGVDRLTGDTQTPNACTRRINALHVELPEAAQPRSFSLRQPLVAAGRIYFHRASEAGDGWDHQVASIAPGNAVDGIDPHSTAIEDLIDAHHENILFLRTPPGSTSQLWLEHAGSAIEIPNIGSSLAVRESSASYYGAPTNMTDGELTAWLASGDVYVFDGRTTITISGEHPSQTAPYVRGGLVAWTTFEREDFQIFVSDRGSAVPISQDQGTHNQWPVITRGKRIVWNSDGRILARAFPEGDVAVLHEAFCSPPVADGDRVVFACGESENGAHRQLFVSDGERVISIATRGGVIESPRISNQDIVWIEYDVPNATCEGHGVGQVIYSSLTAPANPQVIDTIGSPCLCCDSLHPPLELNIEGDIIAWNYAGQDEDIAYAVVERQDCP